MSVSESLPTAWPSSLPSVHLAFLESLLERLRPDARLVGILAGGSYLTNTMDRFSDLDLLIVVEAHAYAATISERERLAGSLGRLLVSFTGEHVGEPRL